MNYKVEFNTGDGNWLLNAKFANLADADRYAEERQAEWENYQWRVRPI